MRSFARPCAGGTEALGEAREELQTMSRLFRMTAYELCSDAVIRMQPDTVSAIFARQGEAVVADERVAEDGAAFALAGDALSSSGCALAFRDRPRGSEVAPRGGPAADPVPHRHRARGRAHSAHRQGRLGSRCPDTGTPASRPGNPPARERAASRRGRWAFRPDRTRPGLVRKRPRGRRRHQCQRWRQFLRAGDVAAVGAGRRGELVRGGFARRCGKAAGRARSRSWESGKSDGGNTAAETDPE
ncbi:hypothetical protein BTHI11S_01877 [Bosea thiooxidans]